MSAFAACGRRIAAGLGVGVVVAGLVVAGPTAPAYAAPCASVTSGVTVVVDFSAFGGAVRVGCAAGDPATGLDALRGAGFTVAGTQRWGSAFVCRIDDRPGVAVEPCVNTPPADAYWGYWHAPRGGAWSYSTVGVTAYNPAPGTVEGWAFGSGAKPGLAPPAAPMPQPPLPPPPQRPTSTPAPRGTGPPVPGATTIVGPPTVAGASPGGAVATDRGLSTMDTAAARVPPAADEPGAGLVGAAAGAALVAALAALAVWTVRRRRAAREGPL